MKGVTFQRLEALRALRSGDGILRAAQGSKSRQGLLSRQLRELEEACGMRLVDRHGRCLQLTHKGEAVVQRYELLLVELGNEKESPGLEEAEKVVRIGGGEVALVAGAIPALSQFLGAIQATVHLKNLRSIEAIQMFRRGELDLVLSSVDPQPLREGESASLLLEDRYIIVVPKGGVHSGGLFLETLLDERIAILEGRTPIRNFLESETRKLGKTLSLGALCSSYGQVLEFVERGKMFGVIPSICAPLAANKSLQVISLVASHAPRCQVWMVHREADFSCEGDVGAILKALRKPKR